MATIYMVRHAENLANVERRMAYKVVDLPLTELGRRQARALGLWFADKPLARIYSSPLKRAKETASFIAETTGAAIVEAEDLRELDVGELDGKNDPATWEIHDAILARWALDEWETPFPGGERLQDAYDRLSRFLQHVAEMHPTEDVAAVGHGGLFWTVLPRICPVPGPNGAKPTGLKNTAVTLLHHESGSLACRAWGGIEHLPAHEPPPW